MTFAFSSHCDKYLSRRKVLIPQHSSGCVAYWVGVIVMAGMRIIATGYKVNGLTFETNISRSERCLKNRCFVCLNGVVCFHDFCSFQETCISFRPIQNLSVNSHRSKLLHVSLSAYNTIQCEMMHHIIKLWKKSR